MICLDTHVVIALIKRRQSTRERLQAALLQGLIVGVPTVVLFELWYGVWKSARPEANIKALAIFLDMGVERWSFEPDDAAEAGEIRAGLERAGTPIGPYDVLIAAQARRRNALLATGNRAEFARVPGLRIEDWTAA